MASPQRPAPPSASADARHDADATFPDADDSFQAERDSFASSQQCSADPSAFVGFHVAPSAENVDDELLETQRGQKRLKLVLDLDARGEDTTRGADFQLVASQSESQVEMRDQFSELFATDTQDEEVAMQPRKTLLVPLKRKRERARDRSLSPPPTMLASVDSALRARMQRGREVKQDDEDLRTDGEKMRRESVDEKDEALPESSAMSEYSEDLAPQAFQTAFAKAASSSDADSGEKNTAEGEDGEVDLAESDRETDDEDEMECTQALDDDEPTQALDDDEHDAERDDKPMTQDCSATSESVTRDEVEAHPYSMSDTGTQPASGVDSTFDDDDEALNGDSKDDADRTRLEESDRFSPVVVQPSDQENCEDEVPSGDASQIRVSDTNIDYLTPRANVLRVEKAGPIGDNIATSVAPKNTAEVNDESKLENDDDQDECMPTQPSEDQAGGEPAGEPSACSYQNGSIKGDSALPGKHLSGADSQTKAIRTLEFSFTSTGSQENEVRSEAGLSSIDSLPSKTMSRIDKSSPFESSISPVCPPIPTPVNGPSSPDNTDVSTKRVAITKQKDYPAVRSRLPTGKKQKSPPESTEPCAQLNSTPSTKGRKRGIFSPESNLSSNASDPMTPQPSVRRTTRSSQSTPSSTPTIRRRAKILSPLPTNRVYASRARTIFKYKFEFCLTGFVNEGEETLTELIAEHGGKIPERYHDVLYKNNTKAVVIGTPVSWRKRKFMQAVACGIPVVHPEWVHACVKAGNVVPFDRYHVPSGYSVTTRKFECLPSQELHIFEGYSFGIVCKPEAKEKANLMAFILNACGADLVHENLSVKYHTEVDVVLCDEYTKTCQYYKKRGIPIKDFQWVTECMILQRFLDPTEPVFEPQRHGRESVSAASAEIGDKEKTTLKLYTGELVLADISGYEIDHFLLFNVCEILSIHVANHTDEGSQSKKNDENLVTLHVGILKRVPNSAGLSKTHTKILAIPASQVKRRVVAVSKEDFESLAYRDESIFYFEDEEDIDTDKEHDHDPAQRRWLTQ